MTIRLEISKRRARQVLVALLAADATLVLAYLLTTSMRIHRRLRQLFDLNLEGNIPAWYSSAQLLLVGLVFLLFTQSPPQARAGLSRAFLAVLGAGFIFLSMDEAAGIHETLTAVLLRFEFLPRFAGQRGIWITLYPAIGILLVVLFYRSAAAFISLYPGQARLFGVGIAVFLAGGIGVEVISFSFPADGANFEIRRILTAVEEALEMTGITIVLYAALLLVPRFTRPGANCEEPA